MKYIEHRRHSMRQDLNDNTSFLSQEGVNLARKVGEEMHAELKSFDLVVTSVINRAIQTPVAMGYAVSTSSDRFFDRAENVEDQLSQYRITFETGFSLLPDLLQPNSPFIKYCQGQVDFYQELLDQIDDGGSILIVTHGGIVEYPLVHMFPNADHKEWGEMFSYCEGYRVGFDGKNFVDLEILRVDK